MALLGTYVNAGAACLAAATVSCFAHGLPTTPDFVTNTVITPSQTSIAVSAVSRGAAHVAATGVIASANEMLAQAFNAIIR